ncbi:MAG: molybdenum cofactor guanylyltransferase [Dehalococcoidia bacterium]
MRKEAANGEIDFGAAMGTSTSISGVVLAGGTSRRFGSDKASALLAGRPMLQWVVDALGGVAVEIVISAAEGQVLPDVTCRVPIRVVTDPVKGQGPLVGMLAGLEASTNETCLVVSCDAPLVQPKLLRGLARRLADRQFEGVIPEVGGRLQALMAAYRRSEVVAVMRGSRDSGNLSVSAAVSKLTHVVTIGEAELLAFDPDLRSFMGVNSAEEMARATALIRGMSS